MLLILFTRLRIVFENTSMALSNHSVLFFNICFVIALILFTLLPILHIIKPSISIWTWCASTFCFYNLSFMMTLTSLFIYKLKQVFTNYIQLNEQAKSHYGVTMDYDDQERLENEKMVKTFTKTSILAITSIVFTSISCILLVARFTFNINSHFIYTLSEWIISIDIYSNFLFITLSYTYFDNIYYKLCGICDNQCQSLWQRLLFGQEFETPEQIANDNDNDNTDNNTDNKELTATQDRVASTTNTVNINVDDINDGDGNGTNMTGNNESGDVTSTNPSNDSHDLNDSLSIDTN